jgi:hypothetical protein
MACLLGLTFVAYDRYILRHFVIVKPDVPFDLSESSGRVETTLYTNNRADEPVYSVLIQVKILTPHVSSDKIQVDIDDVNEKVKAHLNPFNNATAIADTVFYLGTDAHGAESVFVLFPTIPPHTTYAVNVIGVPPKAVAIAHVMTFTLTPHGYVSKSANQNPMEDPTRFLPMSEHIVVRWSVFKIVAGRK